MADAPTSLVTYKAGRDQVLLLVRPAEAVPALQRIDRVMRSEGYAKEKETPDETRYGRGSKAGRILGGGLSGRQEFRVTVGKGAGVVLLCVRGTASVASAGALGISKMRKELARLSELILEQFAPCPGPEDLAPEDLGRFAAVMAGRGARRTGEYVMVIVIMLVVAAVAGCVALAWVLGNK